MPKTKLPTLNSILKGLKHPSPLLPVVKFRETGDSWAFRWSDGKTVYFDKSYINRLISTWVHEKIHILHPDLSENRISLFEARIMKRLTMAEKVKFFKELAMLLET